MSLSGVTYDKPDGVDDDMSTTSINSTATGRYNLKKAIEEQEFADLDGSLLPQSYKPRHKYKASTHLSEALEFRRKFKKERNDIFAADKQKSLELSQALAPEAVLQKLEEEKAEQEEAELVGNFMNGKHWLTNDGVEQHKDLDRETRIHEQSIQVLKDSVILQRDFAAEHRGVVNVPFETPEEETKRLDQFEFIEKISGRMGTFNDYKKFYMEGIRLNDNIYKYSVELLQLERTLRDEQFDQSFDWQSEQTARIMELRALLEVDNEDLGYVNRRLTSLRDEIKRKYPDMSSDILFEAQKQAGANNGDGTSTAKVKEGGEMFSNDGQPVYGWLIGRLTFDGKICCMLYGQVCHSCPFSPSS